MRWSHCWKKIGSSEFHDSNSNAFSALTLLVWWQEGHTACNKTEWWVAGMVICLERGADLHMAQMIPLPLTVFSFPSVKSRLVLPFWYRLTRVVPDKGPLNGCVCVTTSCYGGCFPPCE